MKKIIEIVSVLLVLLSFISCEKDSNTEKLKSEATIVWSGAYEVDGCGFTFIIDEVVHKPINESVIDDKYQTQIGNGTEIMLEYELLNQKTGPGCGEYPSTEKYEAIKIISISSL